MFFSVIYPLLLVVSLIHQNYLRVLVVMRLRPTLLMKARVRPTTHYVRVCRFIRLFDLYSLDMMSSYLSALYAMHLFEKTRPLPYKPAEMMLLSQCRQENLTWRHTFVKMFVYPQAEQQAEKVLLLHGWDGRSIMLRHLAQRLQAKGYTVFAPDLPAHGVSPGKGVSFYDLSRAVIDIERQCGPFSVVIGHSSGGLVGCMAALQGLRFKRMVLISSPCSFGEVLDNYVLSHKLPRHIATSMKKLYQLRYGVNPDKIGPELIAKIQQPVLILHDQADVSIDLEEAMVLNHVLGRSKLIVTEGIGHNGALRDATVFSRISSFLDATAQEDYAAMGHPALRLRAAIRRRVKHPRH
ncbi:MULTISPECIES: alpha/beta hydrolase [Pseudomonas]|uniref:Alpha/beta fold hydrolase n=1 Tax=Pseudomonas tritici TaxID=2745518 RepID=A0A8H9YYV3_9PSED|nr:MULTISPECIES: alpha/beta fold hydrolase [Pseudomonas]MBP2870916.1 alpha/beta fold hydrolase [Pseudomonas sp. SWRI144]MBW8128740.1 alpha/beta fold hydrolase [Pseudomonas sp. LAP_36]MBW8137704.1 alpha/beta fold hydrolase [Pseudomonas sp. PAMC 26818]QXH82336.1 alpha/beta fold hydrolase [Pseudomonas tritici]CRM26670.1 acetoin dehydrogenase E2 subunit dihydrolipoyllysine-residue acetyltransferase [Pseudomonas sp. 24 E 1]